MPRNETTQKATNEDDESIRHANAKLRGTQLALRILRSRAGAEAADENATEESVHCDRQLKDDLDIKSNKGYATLPDLSDDPLKFLRWKLQLLAWLRESRLAELIRMSSEVIAQSRYLQSMDAALYAKLVSKIKDPILLSKVESESGLSGLRAHTTVLHHYEEVLHIRESEIHKQINDLPPVVSINEPQALIINLQRRIQLQEALYAVGRPNDFNEYSRTIFHQIKTCAVPEARLWVNVQMAAERKDVMENLRTATMKLKNDFAYVQVRKTTNPSAVRRNKHEVSFLRWTQPPH
jgi:hypothetical protein